MRSLIVSCRAALPKDLFQTESVPEADNSIREFFHFAVLVGRLVFASEFLAQSVLFLLPRPLHS